MSKPNGVFSISDKTLYSFLTSPKHLHIYASHFLALVVIIVGEEHKFEASVTFSILGTNLPCSQKLA
jgi:hypothetical protein